MKLTTLIFIITFFWFDAARADSNPDNCKWTDVLGGGDDQKSFPVSVQPNVLSLGKSPIGSTMNSSSLLTVHNISSYMIKCPYPRVPNYKYSYSIGSGELADGFTDVFKTGTKGIGVRFVRSTGTPLLGENEAPNGVTKYYSLPKNLKLQFIRTSRDVGQGDTPMDFSIVVNVNGWDAAVIKFEGSINFKSLNYFSGCSGTEKINVSMGRVTKSAIADIDEKNFNLDVLCSGMAAGTKVPVKVYFEGSSDGPGRLNLEPGGAKGVEILLRNERGVNLPFSQSSALSMTWVRSEPRGEIYRLPVVADYVKKPAEDIVPGKANATLNYILEYN